MARKPSISKDVQTLLMLLRVVLETEKVCPEIIEKLHRLTAEQWKDVVQLSYEHKVSALAVDGLQLTGMELDDGLKPVLVPWFNDVVNVECGYAYYVEVLKNLCQIFISNGLTPIILKGYGLSLNYSVPSHRGAGDIDVFLIDKDGKPAAERGDEIVENVLNIDVRSKRDKHHSSFVFKGITVENHKEIACAYRDTEKDIEFKNILQNRILNDFVKSNGICYPSATSNYLLLVQHMFHHFSAVDVTLRQFSDYLTFLVNYHGDIDWNYVDDIVDRCNLKDFVDGIGGLMTQCFGMPEKFLSPSYIPNLNMTNHLIHDLQIRKRVNSISIKNWKVYWKRRWNYRYFKGQSLTTLLLKEIKYKIFK